MQVYVHGGHWQESCKEDCSFAAPAFVVGAGVAFVALGYGLAPQRTLASMVASARRACGGWSHTPLSSAAVRIWSLPVAVPPVRTS
jgi:acetyl esterase/lipase